MFTEREANALITAELLIKAANDSSLIADFSSAVAKLKAFLTGSLQQRTARLEAKTGLSLHGHVYARHHREVVGGDHGGRHVASVQLLHVLVEDCFLFPVGG